MFQGFQGSQNCMLCSSWSAGACNCCAVMVSHQRPEHLFALCKCSAAAAASAAPSWLAGVLRLVATGRDDLFQGFLCTRIACGARGH
eukprot:2388656-Rhodomonas_salina.1